MINDLPSNVESQCVLFADDTTLFSSNSNNLELNQTMTQAVDEATNWFRANGLYLNDNKSQRLVFSLRHNSDINSTVKFLGIHLDKRLTWNQHVDYVCVRLSRVVYLLRRLKYLIPREFLRSSYYAFFNSVIAYGIHLWGNSSSINKVLILQKKAVRIISGAPFDAHCKPLFVKEEIQTVVNMYIFSCLLKIKENLSQYSTKSEIHQYPTRFNHYLVAPIPRLSVTKKWFHTSAIDMFNSLPVEAHVVNNSRFKSVLYKFLIMNPFYNLAEFYNNSANIVF